MTSPWAVEALRAARALRDTRPARHRGSQSDGVPGSRAASRPLAPPEGRPRMRQVWETPDGARTRWRRPGSVRRRVPR